MVLRTCLASLQKPHFPTCHIEVPSWLSECLGFSPASRAGFTFDAYHEDEFDHLLSADPASGSFLSRLPFKRGSSRRPRVATETSSDSSLRSLFIDDRDAELFGDESISMLLTSQPEPTSAPELPLGHQPSEAQDDLQLRLEEEELCRQEEEEIQSKREKARKLALERGLLKATAKSKPSERKDAEIAGNATKELSKFRPGISMSAPEAAGDSAAAAKEEGSSSILPHMRPSH